MIFERDVQRENIQVDDCLLKYMKGFVNSAIQKESDLNKTQEVA